MITLWIGLALADDPPFPMESSAYAFCHDAGADYMEVQPWCGMLDEVPEDVCPGMRATCAGEGLLDPPQGGCDGEQQPDGVTGTFGAPSEPPPELRAPDCGCGEVDLGFLDAFLRWMAAAAVAATVLLLLRAAWSMWQRHAPAAISAPVTPAVVDAIEGDDDLPALPEDELLSYARQALREGRIGDAAIYARGAALRRLARRGLVRLHVSRTDREYLRAVSGDEGPALKTVLGAVEDLRWAGSKLTAERALAAIEAAAKILAVAFGALLWAGPAHGASRYGPDGDAAIAEVLRDAGWDVSWFSGELTDIDDDTDVLFLDVDRVPVDADALNSVLAWVRAGGLLVVTGEVDGLPDLEVEYGESRCGQPVSGLPAGCVVRWPADGNMRLCGELEPLLVPEGEPAVLPLTPWRDLEGTPGGVVGGIVGGPMAPPKSDIAEPEEEEPRRRRRGKRRRMEPVEAPDALPDELVEPLEPIALPAEAAPASGICTPTLVGYLPLEAGYVIVFAGGTFLHNAAMIPPQNRAFLGDLLRTPDAPWMLPDDAKVSLALTVGVGDNNPLRALANLRLLPFVLQLLLTWALLALSRGVHFAAPRDPPDATRRAFSEHARALGLGWMGAGGRRYAASAYARLWTQRLDQDGLVRAATRRGRSEEDATRLAHEVASLAASPEAAETGEEARIVEELCQVTRSSRR